MLVVVIKIVVWRKVKKTIKVLVDCKVKIKKGLITIIFCFEN